MNILEKEIEDIIFSSNIKTLEKRGLSLHKHRIRQFNFGSYGIADLICYTVDDKGQFQIQIVEIKKDEISINTFTQALRYYRAIQIISQYVDVFDIEIILIGKKIDKRGSFCYLPNFTSSVLLYTYHIDMELGVTFQEQRDYKMTNVELPEFNEVFNLHTEPF